MSKLASDAEAVIRQHASETYPNECCGALIASGGSIVEAYRLPNTTTEGARRRFMIGPKQPDAPSGGDAAFYFEPNVWSVAEAAVEAAGASFMSPAITLQKAEGRELALRAFKDPEGHTLALLGWRAA